MISRLTQYIFATALAILVVGCNSDSDTDLSISVANTNAAVNSFQLKPNKDLLTNLDSVFFSIDLATGEIFNADSLPKGTDVRKLQVNIKTPTVSVCDITFSRAGKPDTTVNYLKSQTDYIDFSQGPAKLRITSSDGTVTREYAVRVNVHRSEPDSLYWNETARRPLPSTFETVAAQRSVQFQGKALCVTADASGKYCLATADHPAGEWSLKSLELPKGAELRELTAGADALYIVASGELYRSEDMGATWTGAGAKMDHIYGAFADRILGVVKQGESYATLSYPDMRSAPLPEGMPVEATSDMCVYTTSWCTEPFGVFVGGVKADGNMSGDTWGFDGSIWARLNINTTLPAVTNMTLVPYRAFKTSNIWTVSEESVLLAMGGEMLGGFILNNTVYVSFDRGIKWAKADRLMQLPDYIPAFAKADGLVFSSLMHASGASKAWTPQASAKLPPWLFNTDPTSRAVAPIDEWECPAIYLFGGVNAKGEQLTEIWHGVINRLTFRPLY